MLEESAKLLRVGHWVLLMQLQSMPHDLTMRSMERFARDVMPALRAEFP